MAHRNDRSAELLVCVTYIPSCLLLLAHAASDTIRTPIWPSAASAWCTSNYHPFDGFLYQRYFRLPLHGPYYPVRRPRRTAFPQHRARKALTNHRIPSSRDSIHPLRRRCQRRTSHSDVVHETGWYEDLAAAVLTGLENALKALAPMGQAMKDAYDKATQIVADVLKFGKEHPVFCAVVALGILVILAPWAIEAVGFGELGPIEGLCISVYVEGYTMLMCCLLVGTFAAWWQSRYAGYVPRGSLFSFFQRLGMVWRLKLVASPVMAV